MKRTFVPLIAATAAAAGVPAVAQAAPAVALQKPGSCAVDQGKKLGTTPVAFTITGLAPGQTGNVTMAGTGITASPVPYTADAAGNVTASVPWTDDFEPLLPTGDVPVTLTVPDASGAALATTPAAVGNAGLQIGTKAEAKKKKVPKQITWQVSGLGAITGNDTYYAFFFDAKQAAKKKLKVVGSMKLGTGTGACGYLKAKRPLAPFSKKGAYVVAITTTSKFDPKALGLIGAVKLP